MLTQVIEEEDEMHPEYLQMTVKEHELELSRRARSAALRRELAETAAAPQETVLLRLCTIADDPALDRLALLEGRPIPTGRHVVAELDGAIVAALPLAGGPAIADPFRPTVELLPLLELRREQLAPPHASAMARIAARLQPAR
jgi:hypothetical protein